MENSQYKFLSKFLRVLLEIVFYLGLVSTITLPFILQKYPGIVYRYFWFYLGDKTGRLTFTIILIEIFGAVALVVVRQLVLIFKSINADNPFIKANVRRLWLISVCCFIVFVTFFLKCVFYFTLMSLLLTAAFLIAGLAALVFSRLFHQAVEYKSEDDLTI